MVDGHRQGKYTSQVSWQWDASLVSCYWTALTAVTQGLEGGIWITNYGLNFCTFMNHITF